MSDLSKALSGLGLGDNLSPTPPKKTPDLTTPSLANMLAPLNLQEPEEPEEPLFDQLEPLPATSPAMSLEPTPLDEAKLSGYTESPLEAGFLEDIPLREMSSLEPLERPTLSNSSNRNSLLYFIQGDEYEDKVRAEFIKSYVRDLLNESSGPEGQRPEDQRIRNEKDSLYKDFAIGLFEKKIGTESVSPRFDQIGFYDRADATAEEIYDDLKSEESVGGAAMPFDSSKEYSRRILQEELGKSDISADKKKLILKEFNAQQADKSLGEEALTPEDVLRAFVYDVSKIKTGESDVGDIYKSVGGALNLAGGLTGLVVSSAAAPFLEQKYYIKNERPLSPVANYRKIEASIQDLIYWRSSGQQDGRDPQIIAQDIYENKRLEGNDAYIKIAAEVSSRGRRIRDPDGEGVLSVPYFSPADVIRYTNKISDNEEKIKKKIANLLLKDSKYPELGKGVEPSIYAEGSQIEDISRQDPKFKETVNKLYRIYSGVVLAEEEVYDILSSYEKKYADVFSEFLPKETGGSKAAEVLQDASFVLFESGPIDDVVKAAMLVGDDNPLKKLLSVLPVDQRKQALKELSGVEFIGATTTGGLPQKVLSRRALLNSLAVRYVQREEEQQISELAASGGLGRKWRGDFIRGTPQEIERKKKLLHSFANTAFMMETIANNPDFQDSVSSFYGNLGTGIAETPYQILLSVAAVDSFFGGQNIPSIINSLGGDVDPDQFEKDALAKWEADPAMAIADIVGLMALSGKAIRRGTISASSMKDAYGIVKQFADEDGMFFKNVFSKDGIKALFEQYKTEKKTNSAILEETLKSSEDTFVTASTDELIQEIDELSDVNATTVISPEHTIGQYQAKINKIDEEIDNEIVKGDAAQDKAKIERLQAERLALVQMQLARTEMGLGKMTATVADESLPFDESVQVKVGDIAEEAMSALEESFLSKEEFSPETLESMTQTQRKDYIKERVESNLNDIDELYKANPEKAYEDSLFGKRVVDRTAKGFNISNYSKKQGAVSLLRALIASGVDDYRVYKYIQTIQDTPFVNMGNDQIARAISVVRNAKYKYGVKKRNDVSRALNSSDTPMNVISKTSRKNPRVINSEFESLAIADELAASGVVDPSAYLGLNLTNEQIAGYMTRAQGNKKTSRIVKKIQDPFTGEYDSRVGEVFDTGPVAGAFITSEDAARASSPLPREISITEDIGFVPRVGRAAAKTIVGEEGLNLINKYRETKQTRFVSHLVAESLLRPFATVNIPGWVKNVREELLLYGMNSDGPAAPYMVKVLDFFAQGSQILGKEKFHDLRMREGSLGYAFNRLMERLPVKESFEITDDLILRTFKNAEDANNANILRTFDRGELHQYGSVLHRMSDAEIVDTQTGKRYNVNSFLDRTVYAKELLNNLAKRLSEKAKFFMEDGNQPVYEAIISRANNLKKRATSGDPRVSVNDVFPQIENMRQQYINLSEKQKMATLSNAELTQLNIVRTVLSVYESFTANDVLAMTSDVRYSPKIPVSQLDDFQKSITILANEFIKPRRDSIFDLVTQIVTGEETNRLMFNNGGLKTIVVKIAPDGTETIAQKFPQTQKGYFEAVSFRNKSGDGFVLKNQDQLVQDAYLKERGAPLAPKTERLFDIEGADVLREMTNHISDYFDQRKTADFIEAQLSSLEQGTGAAMRNQSRLAESLLAAMDGGNELLKQSGFDPLEALKRALSLNAKDQKEIVGRVLTSSERNFMQKISEKRYTPDELLEMYTDYQFSFIKTVSNLMNNVHQLKLQSYLRSKGFILSESEYNALPRNVQKNYAEVNEVVAKGEAVFPSTMSGGFVNKRVASFFQRQVALQRAMQEASVYKKVTRAIQTGTKAGLLFDFLNNSIAVNLFGGIFTQSIFHGRLPLNPRYYKKTYDILKSISNGKIIKDEKIIRIIKAHVDSDTSVKRDVVYTQGNSLLNDLVSDMYEHAANTNILKNVNDLKSVKNETVFNRVVAALRLDALGPKLNRFLDAMKLEDLDRQIDLDETKLQKARRYYNVATDKFFKAYQYPDLVNKIAYQLQLEDAKYSPASAYKQSLDKYIDYVDVSPFLNFFRYGGAGGVGSLFSPLTSDFLTFSAAQVNNHWNAITNNPVRTFIFAHLARTNDRALEETLKTKMTLNRIRSLMGDPTLQALPGYATERATGSEFGPQRDFMSGFLTYSGERFTGVPAPIAIGPEETALLPLLPGSPSSIMRYLPQNMDEMTAADQKRAIMSYFTNQYGSVGNQAIESELKQPTEAKLNAEKENELIELGVIEGETNQNVRGTKFLDGAARIFGTRFIPRIFRSAYEFALPEGKSNKYSSQKLFELFGISAKPFDYRSIPKFRVYSFMKSKDLNREYKNILKASSEGKKVDIDRFLVVTEELNRLKQEAKKRKYSLTLAQQDAFLYTQLELLGKVLQGEIEIEEIDNFITQFPK